MPAIYLKGLHDALAAALGSIFQGATFPCDNAAPPLLTVHPNIAGQVGVSWGQAPSDGQKTTAASTIAAYDLSSSGQLADRPLEVRPAAKLLFARSDLDQSTLFRAVAGVLVDELNFLREWTVALKAAVAAATSLANLQTRVAALDTLGDRTLGQAKAAITSKVDSGTAD